MRHDMYKGGPTSGRTRVLLNNSASLGVGGLAGGLTPPTHPPSDSPPLK